MPTKSKFNVIVNDVNSRKMYAYDVLPYLEEQYRKCNKKDRPNTVKEFNEFVTNESRYMFWSRCEWEIIISDLPHSGKCEEKWDVFDQILMNIDIVVELLMRNVNIKSNATAK